MNHSASVSPRRLALPFVTFLTLPVLLLVPALPQDSLAQDAALPGQPAQESSFPDSIVVDEDGSRFGRLRFLEGEVLVEGVSGVRDGSYLEPNVPVMAGDRLLTREGRAEIQFPDGSFLRLDEHTEVEIIVVADMSNQWENRTVLRLVSGSAFLLVENIESQDDVFRVDTPTASVFFLTRGIFRVDAEDGSRTVLSSHNGVAEIVSEETSVLVRSGERSNVMTGHAPSQPWSFNYFQQDEFDRWNRARQGAYVKPYDNLPTQQVPAEVRPYVTELAYYGDWIEDPEYGWVWRPDNIDDDWGPYRVGHWYSTPAAGTTWVSYESWGWAPYHYGRWNLSVGLGWFWIPGSIYSGGWVSWSHTPAYIGWCPLNYYNRPLIVTAGYYGGHHYPHRSWVYLDKRHAHRRGAHRWAAPAHQGDDLHRRSTPWVGRRAHNDSDRRGDAGSRDRRDGRDDGRDGRDSRDDGRDGRDGRGDRRDGARVVQHARGSSQWDDNGDRVSFRTLEGQGRVRSGAKTPRDGRSVRTPSVKPVAASPSATPRNRRQPAATAPSTRTPANRGTQQWTSSAPRSPTPDATRRSTATRRQKPQTPPATTPRRTPTTAQRTQDPNPASQSRVRRTPPRQVRPAEQGQQARGRGSATRPQSTRAEDRRKLLEKAFRQRSAPARPAPRATASQPTRKPAATQRKTSASRPQQGKKQPPRVSRPQQGKKQPPRVSRPNSSSRKPSATQSKSRSRSKSSSSRKKD